MSTGHTGTDVAVASSRQAEAEGGDALMVLPPYFLKPDADGIFEYFRAIDEAVGIPIMVQDAPLMTQVGLGVSAMKHNLVEWGVIATTRVRHPTRTLDEIGRQELETLRQSLDLSRRCPPPE